MGVKTTTACLALAAACLAQGCVSPQNDRITIGRELKLEGFTAAPTPASIAAAPPAAEQVQAPSLVGIDRGHWERTVFMVPVDGLAHAPIYTKRVMVTDKTRRQQDRFPTALTALELYGGSEQQQQLEALYNQGMALADIALLLPRMVWTRPWMTRWSPDEAYERYWHPERPEPDAAFFDGSPYSQPEPQRITP